MNAASAGGSSEGPDDGATAGRKQRYPDYLMPYVNELPEADAQFDEAREAFLLGYGYQTARAYRADLDDIYRPGRLPFPAIMVETRVTWAVGVRHLPACALPCRHSHVME